MSELQKIVVLCLLIIVIVVGVYVGTRHQGGRVIVDSDSNETQIDPPSLELDAGPDDTTVGEGVNSAALDARTSTKTPPDELVLPFRIEDISDTEGLVNPLGVVRSGKDRADIGHSGIDIPLIEGAPIIAVAEGEIVDIRSADDPWGGRGIYQLITKTGEGEGWGFVYEHVIPKEGLSVGDTVSKGELIATKAAPESFTAHFQLSSFFENFTYTKDNRCWPDFLDETASAALGTWWGDYRNSRVLLSGWQTTNEAGVYPFRGLLDQSKFPEGPALCYAPGTDVR